MENSFSSQAGDFPHSESWLLIILLLVHGFLNHNQWLSIYDNRTCKQRFEKWILVKIRPDKKKTRPVRNWNPALFSLLPWTSLSYSFPKPQITYTWFSYIRIFVYSSFHGFITNQHYNYLTVGLLAQLVEHCTGNGEVMVSNPIEAWIS